MPGKFLYNFSREVYDMKLLAIGILIAVLLAGCTFRHTTHSSVTEAQSQTATTIYSTSVSQEQSESVCVDPVLELLASMSVEEKVGQLFLATCPETNQTEDIEIYHPCGYILFQQDFENQTPQSIKQLISNYQAVSSIPMLIAVDEEGGTVCRVSSNSAFTAVRFPSPRNAFSLGGMEYVLTVEKEKAALLASLGINVNLAPVCDITTLPSSFMYKRSLGQSAEVTAQFVTATVAQAKDLGVGCVLKHFPGYGNNTDTHTGIAIDRRTIEELSGNDLIPFQTAINNGCGAIMVSHTIVQCLDAQRPASLSPAVHRYLRENMGFDGVIITDDLIMGAIVGSYESGEAAVTAVLAGNDLLCSTAYQVQYPAVLHAVNSGRISEEMLDQSVLRILRWKQSLGLLPE